MEVKIIAGLKDIGYQGALLQKANLKKAVEYGSKSIEYTVLVNYLTTEIRTLAGLDEQVNPISTPEDSVSFMMELNSFLKELGCPYNSLTQGHISDRLQNVGDRELLLDYLITELMIARMNQEKKPKTKLELKLQESPEASDLKQILMALQFPKPPEDITIHGLFEKVTPRIEELIKKTGIAFVGKAFFSGFLSDKQWKMLSQLDKDLNNDYRIRREMLLTRLDVTIQSFQWSHRTKGKEEYFLKTHKDERNRLLVDPNVDLSHLLAARTDLAIIEKTSSSNVRKNTKTSIQKVIIGEVPDRGGRTNEIAPPPPEMPSWQQRTPGPDRGGRGGSNQGRGRGSYSQGSYNQGGGQQSFSNVDSQSDSRGNKSYGSSNSKSVPFSNFNTSLSMYSQYSPLGSRLGNFKTQSDHSGSRDFAGSDKNNYSNDRRGVSNNSERVDSYENLSKRPRTNYKASNEDSALNNYSQKRSFNIAGDNEESGNYHSRTSSGNYGGDRQSNYTAYDSAGSYAVNKRVKSYDSFRTDNPRYSDQYVRDTQHNQQNQSRNEYSRGRSNYRRGQGNR